MIAASKESDHLTTITKTDHFPCQPCSPYPQAWTTIVPDTKATKQRRQDFKTLCLTNAPSTGPRLSLEERATERHQLPGDPNASHAIPFRQHHSAKARPRNYCVRPELTPPPPPPLSVFQTSHAVPMASAAPRTWQSWRVRNGKGLLLCRTQWYRGKTAVLPMAMWWWVSKTSKTMPHDV